MVVEQQVRFSLRFNCSIQPTNLRSPIKCCLLVYLILFVYLHDKCLLVRGQDSANDSNTETDEPTPPPKQLTCDFGTSTEVNTCNFEINNQESHPNVKWKLGHGTAAFWLGGPLKDRTTMENTGGYLYLDTSFKLVNKIYSTAALESGEKPSIKVKSDLSSHTNSSSSSRSRLPTFASFTNHHARYSNNKFTPSHSAYERKFMQELWHSNNNQIPNSKTFSDSIFNNSTNLVNQQTNHQTDQQVNRQINKTIPFHNAVSSVLNRQSNETIYKQQLIAVSDVLNSPMEPPVPNSAFILSPNISATGPMGNCIRFYYNMDGLSCDKLRVLVLDIESNENQTLWETSRQTDNEWTKAEISYAHDKMHKLVFDGTTKPYDSPERSYRGFTAVDDFSYAFLGDDSTTAGMCHGHCTFEGGLCGWTNLAEEDDFDWSQGKGSDSLYTGPSRDYYSFSREFSQGGYLFIDSSYPRRPGDRALLRSPQFPAPVVGTGTNADLEKQENNGPLCLKFAVHMFGNGIGTLRVKVRSAEEGEAAAGEEAGKNDRILWEMNGESGNRWYLAQLSYASTNSYFFLFEGVVGPNELSNIAIDSITIEQGACPISPQTASRKSGDCTFEESMCSWTNANQALGLDHFDWSRQFSYGLYGPKTDHTRVNTNGYFMSLNGDNSLQRGGSYAWLISPQLQSPKQANSLGKCMSFYYFMYQRTIEPGGPSLGGLRVHIRTIDAQGDVILIPIWRLNNHQSMRWRQAKVLIRNDLFTSSADAIYQVVIEGVWGDARIGATIALDDVTFYDTEDVSLCKTLPENAASVQGECSFDRGLCGWKNDTLDVSNGKLNQKSDSQSLNGKNSLIPHKISVTSGGVSGLIGAPQSSSALNLNNIHLFSRPNSRPMVSWRLATSNSRPNNLQDHTFRAPVGYVYFDVFNQQYMQQPTLRSVKFAATTGDDAPKSRCLSFWFSAFGRGDNSILSVHLMKLEDTGESSDSASAGTAASPSGEKKDETTGGGDEKTESSNKMLLWTIQSRLLETRRNLWYYGQTTINVETDHHVIFQGEATDGGFAIDDITFYNGTCATRPMEASVKVKTDES